MNIDIQKIIYKHLSIVQMNEILVELETLAKEKHGAMCHAYEIHPDAGIEQDFQQIIDDSHWENFLPSQYHSLKYYRDEKERQAS